MKYNWDPEKNNLLTKERGISFEDVVFHIANGNLLDDIENPNKNKYTNQFIYIIKIADYAYLVPYVYNKKKEEIFLKTIYPSRKYTKIYPRYEEE